MHRPALTRVQAAGGVDGVSKITAMPSLLRRRIAWVMLIALVVAAMAPGISRALAFAQGQLAPWSVLCSAPGEAPMQGDQEPRVEEPRSQGVGQPAQPEPRQQEVGRQQHPRQRQRGPDACEEGLVPAGCGPLRNLSEQAQAQAAQQKTQRPRHQQRQGGYQQPPQRRSARARTEQAWRQPGLDPGLKPDHGAGHPGGRDQGAEQERERAIGAARAR